MKDMLIKMLQALVLQGIEFSIRSKDNVFYSYDDSTGQRSCKLYHFGYGKLGDPVHAEKSPGKFKVVRKCSFINKGDEGKDDAVLMVIDADNASPDTIKVSSTVLEFNGLILTAKSEIQI